MAALPTGAAAPRPRPWLFLGLVLLVSIPFWLLAVVTGGRGFVLGLPASVVMIVVPAAVAGLLVVREAGLAGLRGLWSGIVDLPRVRPRGWWVVGLAAAPVAAVLGWLVAVAVAGASGAPRLDAVPGAGPSTPWLLAPVYFAVFLAGAVPEEVGWTGYATASLVDRHGVVGAGVVIGVAWQLWHVVPHLAQGRSATWILGMVVLGILLRILMVMAYRHGGRSLTLACAMHAMSNTAQLYPHGLAGFDPWPSVVGMLVVLPLAATMVTVRRR